MPTFRNSEAARGLTLIAPPALYALLLLAVPLTAILGFSFWTQDFLTIDYTPTLDNYREALALDQAAANAAKIREDAETALKATDFGLWDSFVAFVKVTTAPIVGFFQNLYAQLILRSVLIAGAVTLATVLLAYPIAYFVSFHVAPGRKSLWIFLITIPFWTAYLIRVFLWKVILGFNGVINTTLIGLGVIEAPLEQISYSPYAVVITLAHAFAPFAILPIFVSLEKIDRSLLEASQDLGENRIMTFLRVTLPLSVPGVVAAVLIVFIPTIGDYVTPRLVGGPDGLMIANMIQVQFLRLNNAPLGATLAVIAMAIVTVISLLFILLNRRWLKGRAA